MFKRRFRGTWLAQRACDPSLDLLVGELGIEIIETNKEELKEKKI